MRKGTYDGRIFKKHKYEEERKFYIVTFTLNSTSFFFFEVGDSDLSLSKTTAITHFLENGS